MLSSFYKCQKDFGTQYIKETDDLNICVFVWNTGKYQISHYPYLDDSDCNIYEECSPVDFFIAYLQAGYSLFS
jgi:hypothetical protein